MNGEIICVGTELLLGNIVNTNAQYLGQGLAELGINMYNQSVVGDNPARLKAALREAMERSDVIILTGGLGPTADDITKETVAEVVGAELELHEDVLCKLEEYYSRQGRIMPKGVEKQAQLPVGAKMFHNEVGTAPGFAIEKKGCKIITIPGPPREMKAMFDGYVKPYLKGASGRSILSNDLHIYGIGESEVEGLLGELLEGYNPTAATYAKLGEVTVRVTASAESEEEATYLKEDLTRKIADKLGAALYLVGEGDLSYTAVETLKSKGLKVATAESCTAGMLSKSITDIGGSSAVFEMGVSAYANEIKRKVLGVPETVLERYGAVSAETAAVMAKGVRTVAGSDIGIGITGVAGPEPSEGKPVGLVYIGMTDGERVWIRELNAAFGNDREKVRAYATLAALDLIRRYAAAYPAPMGGGAVHGEDIKILKNAADFTLPEDCAAMGLLPLSELFEISPGYLKSEPKTNPVALTPEEINGMNGMDMIGFVEDPDAHIGYEDIATDTDEFITEDFDEVAEDEEVAAEETTEKKPGFIIRVLKYILPWKGDRFGEVLRKIVFFIALVVFISTGIYLINYMRQGNVNEGMVEDAREVYTAASDGVDNSGMLLKYSELYKQNPDIVGWISIDGTKVDYPVYQCDDNDFYVTHDMSRKESRYGAIFADCKAKITLDGNSKNLVLYGHNMIDDSMFGSLLEYNDIKYYRKNPVIDFDTIYGEGEYKIFSVIITNVDKNQDNGMVFNYMRNSFANEKDFLSWIENVERRSIIETSVDVVASDEILTLSTCSYEFDNARTVVFARKVRDGESRRVNIKDAQKNPSPLFPQAYYDKYGGSKPKLEELSEDTSSEEVEPDTTETKIVLYKAGGKKIIFTEEELEICRDESGETEFGDIGNYVGYPLNDAVKKLNKDGFCINEVKYLEKDEEENIIMKQNTRAGTELAKGSGIDVTVTGEPQEVIPVDFVGLTLKEARKVANDCGLTYNVVIYASQEKKNTVIMQSLEPDKKTTERCITLYVSNGKSAVPKVLEVEEKTAVNILEKAGFKVECQQVETEKKEKVGKVISQNPTYGEQLDEGTLISLFIGIEEEKKDKDDKESTASGSNESAVVSELTEAIESELREALDSSEVSESRDKKGEKTSSKSTVSKLTIIDGAASKVTASKTSSSEKTTTEPEEEEDGPDQGYVPSETEPSDLGIDLTSED